MLDRVFIAINESIDLVIAVLNEPTSRVIALIALGAFVGSFLNVVIYRLPSMLKERALADSSEFFPDLVSEAQAISNIEGANLGGFSKAPCCDTQIKAKHNIPIISWLTLKGKCAYCGAGISSQYIKVEVLTALAFGTIAFISDTKEAALLFSALTAIFIAIAYIDQKHQLIPEELNLAVAVIGAILIDQKVIGIDLTTGLLSVFGTYFCLSLLNFFSECIVEKQALGGGDIKLMAALSLIFTTTGSLIITGMAILSLIILNKILFNRAKGYQALGPYLAIISWVGVIVMF
ncbi:A24 family peptidase [Vibrio sp. Evd11]|uniref:prepilin peptidase n=1 Tax=Vibrio sp. Evd11 TaxID=1207404 RepID=UPI000EFD5709|nr:A24 family peptidase [Vibrio sp. Evd11]